MTKHWADVYVQELRDRAERMKAFGDDRGAAMCTEVAREIEARRAAWEDEELTAAAGAAESGYTSTRLRELRHDGQWSGRRRDLPRKPALEPQRPKEVTGDVAKERGGQLSIADRVLRRQAGGESRRRRASQ